MVIMKKVVIPERQYIGHPQILTGDKNENEHLVLVPTLLHAVLYVMIYI